MTAARLRQATPADVPDLDRIAHDAYAPYLDRMPGRRPAPMDADHAALVGRADVWVAVVGSDVVGYLVLVAESEVMLLDTVAVDPGAQGRGVGRALLAFAEDRARSVGLSRVRLYTHEVMHENQALYVRLGYVETRRATEGGLDRVFYEKGLGARPDGTAPASRC